VEEVHSRAAATLEAILSQLERLAPNRHSRIVLFTHAATAIALARGLLDDPHRPMRIGCCTLSVFQRAPDAPSDALLGHGVWHAESIGDGSYLKEGALRDWGFEDVQIENGKVWAISIIFETDLTLIANRSSMILVIRGPRTKSMILSAFK
jgi:transcription factor C subunit 7